MRDTRPMKLAQGRLGGTKIAGIALRLGDMQRYPRDPAPHQHAVFGTKEAWPHIERGSLCQCAALAPEQKVRKRLAPPWHLVDAPKHGFDLTVLGAEIPALYGGEDVALEHDLAPPASV